MRPPSASLWPRITRFLTVPAHPVRLQTVGAPDALNRTYAEPCSLRYQGAAPMGRLSFEHAAHYIVLEDFVERMVGPRAPTTWKLDQMFA
jgi:hypothetical protein